MRLPWSLVLILFAGAQEVVLADEDVSDLAALGGADDAVELQCAPRSRTVSHNARETSPVVAGKNTRPDQHPVEIQQLLKIIHYRNVMNQSTWRN